MLAIKFKADVHGGVIEIPFEYQETLKNHVEIIALVNENNHEKAKKKSVTYANMMELNKLLGGDHLLEAVLKGMPEDFTYVASSQSDREIWFEECKHKYE